jgi:hypothetical protein
MTKLDEVTGNPVRSEAIMTIVREATVEGDCSLETVSLKTDRFGFTFGELSQDEFDAAVATLQHPSKEPDTAASVTDQDTPTMTRDEANAELARRKDALQLARRDRMVAENNQRLAREAITAAIMEWQTGAPSKDEITRREIAAINADRRNKVERGDQRRPGRSYHDRSRFNGAGGNASDYVRMRPPLTEAEARKLGGHGPGTKGNARGAHRVQTGPAKLHGEP